MDEGISFLAVNLERQNCQSKGLYDLISSRLSMTKQNCLAKVLHNEDQTSLLSLWCAVHKKLYIPGLGST